MTDDARLQAGLQVRTEVLGSTYVRRSLDGATPFTLPMQELVTEYCWGTIWTRPGLGRRERSLINLAMLAALGRPDELALHVEGAVRNGCTVLEIQEALLQVAVYCGVPAGVEAFRVAEAVLATTERAEPVDPGVALADATELT